MYLRAHTHTHSVYIDYKFLLSSSMLLLLFFLNIHSSRRNMFVVGALLLIFDSSVEYAENISYRECVGSLEKESKN